MFKLFKTEHHKTINPRQRQPEPVLTADIYAADGTINWDNPNIRDAVFVFGAGNFTLENYVFLYEVSKLRGIAASSAIGPLNKDIAARAIAKQLYKKHLEIQPGNNVRYEIYVAKQKFPVESAINISDELFQQFTAFFPNLEQKTAAEIIKLFEDAVSEITPTLNLPKRRTQNLRARENSGVSYASTSNAKSGAFIMFTPSTGAASNNTSTREKLQWGRQESDDLRSNTTSNTQSNESGSFKF